MKVIIAGMRDFKDYNVLLKAIKEADFNITEVVSGRAKGVDAMGETYAKINNIPVKPFPAQWALYGKSAGHRRNWQMAEYADALIAIWNGRSRGTGGMIRIAKNHLLKIYVERV